MRSYQQKSGITLQVTHVSILLALVLTCTRCFVPINFNKCMMIPGNITVPTAATGVTREQHEVQSTVFAIPFLFQREGNCSSNYHTTNSLESGFYFVSQTYNNPTTTTIDTKQYKTYGSITETHSFHLYLRSNENCDNDIYSLCYLCEKKVFGIYFKMSSNPSFTMIVHLLGPNFHQTFAALPLVSGNRDTHAHQQKYEYRVVFGPPYYIERRATLDGIVIQGVHDDTTLVVELDGEAVVIRNWNDQMSASSLKKRTVNKWETFWIEPKLVQSCLSVNMPNGYTQSLQGVKISSSKPIMVFTNQAMCNSSTEFSYQSQLVHQMPEQDKWGTKFIIDTQQVRILPSSHQDLEYDWAIRSSHNETNVSMRYHFFNTDSSLVEQLSVNTEEVVYIRKDETYMKSVRLMTITASDPVLIILGIHTKLSTNQFQDEGYTYYSILLQPTEWFSNKQIVVLSHPKQNPSNSYHISVTVPRKEYSAEKILLSKADEFCETTTLAEHKGFNRDSVTGIHDEFVLLYLEISSESEGVTKSENVTQLIVRHSHPNVSIGVSVLAYSPESFYAYSNGYVANSTSFDQLKCPDRKAPVSKAAPVGVVVVLVVVIIAAVVVVIVFYYFKKRSIKRRSNEFLLVPPTDEPDPDLYEYDVFIILADEDEQFVRRNICEPLEMMGYSVLWQFDPPAGFFQAGNVVLEDTKRAMSLSRRVVFVCTKYVDGLDREITYCRDEQSREGTRRIIPIIIESEYTSNHFKNYTQIRLKKRDLDKKQEECFHKKLTNNIGNPIEHQRRNSTPLDNIL